MILWQNLYISGSLEGDQKKIETDQKNEKFGIPKFFNFFGIPKIFFWSTKKMRNWYTKKNKLVYQRD